MRAVCGGYATCNFANARSKRQSRSAAGDLACQGNDQDPHDNGNLDKNLYNWHDYKNLYNWHDYTNLYIWHDYTNLHLYSWHDYNTNLYSWHDYNTNLYSWH